MADHRYKCVGCGGEFTLHDGADHGEAIDPAEFDPACPWCSDTTGLPCWVPPPEAPDSDHAIAVMQRGTMQHLQSLRKEDESARRSR